MSGLSLEITIIVIYLRELLPIIFPIEKINFFLWYVQSFFVEWVTSYYRAFYNSMSNISLSHVSGIQHPAV